MNTRVSNPTLKDDPNVKIPKAVKAASERAEEFHKMYRDQPEGGAADDPDNGDSSNGAAPTNDDPENGVTPAGNPDTDPGTLTGDSKPDDSKPGDQKPGDSKPDTSKLDETPGDDASWEAKYRSMHGRFMKSTKTIADLQNENSNLRGVIATMEAAGARGTQPQEQKLPDLSADNLLTDEEKADYGEDFLNVVGKRARQEVAPLIKSYTDEIAQLRSQLNGVSGVVKQTAQQKLHENLDRMMPEWREMNTDDKFLQWLSLPDAYSGAIRHDMLKSAYAQGDALRVANFFKGFLAEVATVEPVNTAPSATDTPGSKVSKVPLETLAAPGRAKTAATNHAPAEKPIITRAQVSAFYADVAANKYRGRDEEKNRLEAMIFAAQADGRIR